MLRVSARASIGISGLALVGCGGDDDDADETVAPAPVEASPPAVAPRPSPVEAPPISEPPQDPVRGGVAMTTLGTSPSGEPPTLDPYATTSALTTVASSYHYSRLLRFASGPEAGYGDYAAVVPDAAATLPEVVDPLTHVYTLREDLAFHHVEPTNGRLVTSADVVFNNARFQRLSGLAQSWEAAVDDVTPIDERSFVMSLRRPFAPMLTLAASPELLRLVPREIVDDDSVATRPVGSGPWVFDVLAPGLGMRWRRNPAWHEEGFPLLDEVRATFVDDATSVVDQLEARALDWSRIAADSYEPDVREARSLETLGGPDNSVGGFFFDYSTPPWSDVRARQALSMSLRRDVILERLDGSGRGTLQTALPALAPFYLDPLSDDFGPTGQFFGHGPLMARQLLEAAGLSGLVPLPVITSGVFEERFGRQIDLLLDSARSVGFDASLAPLEYGTYLTTVFRGNFPEGTGGVAVGPLKVAIDPDEVLFSVYHWSSERHNWGPGPGSPAKDAVWLEAFERQRAEQDRATRVAQLHDLQRDMAERMYVVPWTSPPEMWLRGEWVHDLHVRGGMGVGREVAPYAWLDASRDG